MKRTKQTRRIGTSESKRLSLWSRLQWRMTASYVLTNIIVVLLLEVLLLVVIHVFIAGSPLIDTVLKNTARNTASFYGQTAALQAQGTTLDPRSTFQPGQAISLDVIDASDTSPLVYLDDRVPYIDNHASSATSIGFALLISLDGKVLASSYPARYPVLGLATDELPQRAAFIHSAQAGNESNIVEHNSSERVALAVQPVWNRDHTQIGVIYVQMQLLFSNSQPLPDFALGWFGISLIWLLPLVLLGTTFGVFTTRGLVRRIHRLVEASRLFAAGDYTQKVPTKKHDEVGQLESQFNSMAKQLVASIARQQELAEQQVRIEERARIEQEMLTAQHIQRSLLPSEVPTLPDWHFIPYYKPAKEVGGDFYDFIIFDDGKLGIVIGDVSGKGVPAALMMAMTCTMLRTVAQEKSSPGETLAKVNELLCVRIPPGTFVTCFYGVLDVQNGYLRFANAGHDLPYHRQAATISELRATGMPLGLMPGMLYDESDVVLAPGESVLFYSDGLVEAHNPQREMFGFPRLRELLGVHAGSLTLIDDLLNDLIAFTGDQCEQEDDVTLITLQRKVVDEKPTMPGSQHSPQEASFESTLGNERQAMEWVAGVVQPLRMSAQRIDSLKTAVAELVMNAMEHGNHYRQELKVTVQVLTSATDVIIRVGDQGEGRKRSITVPEKPDLLAKLAGQETPRGWGLFLVKSLVDEMHEINAEHSHTMEIVMHFADVDNGKES